FSSRRRHTRFSRDWSSDVCSSDLRCWTERRLPNLYFPHTHSLQVWLGVRVSVLCFALEQEMNPLPLKNDTDRFHESCYVHTYTRSEERRVGKECRICGERRRGRIR